jgi:hypothetical protein
MKEIKEPEKNCRKEEVDVTYSARRSAQPMSALDHKQQHWTKPMA